jgi:hypothetical protein
MAENIVNQNVLSEEIEDKNNTNILKDDSNGVSVSQSSQNIARGRKISIKSHYNQLNINKNLKHNNLLSNQTSLQSFQSNGN